MAVFFTVLALTMGLPTPDAESDAFDMASHEVTVLLQQGKDESACADLAKSLIDEVTAKVESANKLLATFDDGSDCSSKGQDAVTAARTEKTKADKAAKDAASAASAAADTNVDFGSYSLKSLTEGTCTQFWSDPSYKRAKDAASNAAIAKTQADAKAKVMDTSLASAKDQAAKDVKTCQCAVRTSYDTAFAEATKTASDDAAAFTKGKHMECVLKGTPAADCKVGDVPAVTPITLAKGVPHQCVPEDDKNSPSSDTQEPERKCGFMAIKGTDMSAWYHSKKTIRFKYRYGATKGNWIDLNSDSEPFTDWYVSKPLGKGHTLYNLYDLAAFNAFSNKLEKIIWSHKDFGKVDITTDAPTSAQEADKLC